MMNAYTKLESLFKTLSHLDHLQAIAGWDEAVMMPSGGGKARTSALATLKKVAHQKLTDKSTGILIDQAKGLPLEPWQQANLALIEKQYQNATCLEDTLVEELVQSTLQTEQAWRKYRAENNWKDFAPLLARNVELTQQSAQRRSEIFNKTPYDILIEDFSPGINQALIDPIFDTLKSTLPQLAKKISDQQTTNPPIPLVGPFPIERQKQLGFEIMQALGFDFNHGRLDVSHHPFCGGVPEDVRITTRYNENEFITAAMGICHETGHARYEQGLPQKWIEQPVGRANSMTVHESQSLLIEMQACRSLPFMHFLSPLIKRHFGHSECFNAENLYRHYTIVKPGYIRVDADEVTYPLHVILRYDIEKALFNKEISVHDLPAVWDEKMREFFNLNTKDNYKDGVMQDVHWAAGLFGYFPAYTLGSLMAAQLYHQIEKKHSTLNVELARGEFGFLFNWLGKHVHARGSSVSFTQLLKEATGDSLNAKYFLTHVHDRYLA